MTTELEDVIDKLTRDLREAARTLSEAEARFLVDSYYQRQDDRIAAAHRLRAATEGGEPCSAIVWLTRQSKKLEDRIKSVLDAYSDAHPLGEAVRRVVGIGPVIAAGLLAHIDIKLTPTAGHIWAFAGLDPSVKWMSTDATKKQIAKLIDSKTVGAMGIAQVCSFFRRKPTTISRYMDGKMTVDALAKAVARRPWNTALKTLCWKAGESFVKFSGKPTCTYGLLWAEYKQQEIERNESGQYAKQAAAALEQKTYGKTTEAYKAYIEGRLPPAHIHRRSTRRTVKLFLSHYHEVGYKLLLGKDAPKPWAIEHGGHEHQIPVPPEWWG
jgi:hypothetical protein